jgi:hypothetical protein
MQPDRPLQLVRSVILMKVQSDNTPPPPPPPETLTTCRALAQSSFPTSCEGSDGETETWRGHSSKEHAHILECELRGAVLFAVCVILGKLFNFSDPQFLHPKTKEESINDYLTGCYGIK